MTRSLSWRNLLVFRAYRSNPHCLLPVPLLSLTVTEAGGRHKEDQSFPLGAAGLRILLFTSPSFIYSTTHDETLQRRIGCCSHVWSGRQRLIGVLFLSNPQPKECDARDSEKALRSTRAQIQQTPDLMVCVRMESRQRPRISVVRVRLQHVGDEQKGHRSGSFRPNHMSAHVNFIIRFRC